MVLAVAKVGKGRAMLDWIVLSNEKHREHFFHTDGSAMEETADLQVVPVLSAELQRVVGEFVIGFAKVGEKVEPVALLGQSNGRHLYIHPERDLWLGSYVPSMMRGYPFNSVSLSDGGIGLAIDKKALRPPDERSASSLPIFNESGALSDHVAPHLEFLRARHTARQRTREQAKLLIDYSLLRPWSSPASETASKNGLLEIDLERLNSLSNESVVALRGMPMMLAYAQLLSQKQMEQVAGRLDILSRVALQAQRKRKEENIDTLFWDEDSFDELIFKK
jgi:hypothetical protein